MSSVWLFPVHCRPVSREVPLGDTWKVVLTGGASDTDKVRWCSCFSLPLITSYI